jgi:glycosyltransferase 2 family protein
MHSGLQRDGCVAAAATGALVVGARMARRSAVGNRERRCFAAINALPVEWHRPVWLVMQAGSLGGVSVSAALAAACGRPRLARQLAVVGAATWVAAKCVKPLVGRARPGADLGARVMGPMQAGLGYPSGHAAVATALATTASPLLSPRSRRAAWAAAATVAIARMYVGAHLPLDVAGGVALGTLAGRAGRSVWPPTGRA